MTEDIEHILKSWAYDPGEDLVVRIIDGKDGQKLQMRIDMGIIQMALDGNPTGEGPENFETWFEYYQHQQKQVEDNDVEDFFTLDEESCQTLRREAVHYYYRYLSLMKLGDYKRVICDTDRNCRVFAFMKKYAASEMDRWSLDQYRPYVIMMNTRANASLTIKEGQSSKDSKTPLEKALEFIDEGIGKIIGFYEEYGISSEAENSIELSVLKALKTEFIRNIPMSPEELLKKAVSDERFEDAAALRDIIRLKHKSN
ncbi:MAG: hypothetical protein HOC71_03720 [Candidatus Latescibacteria bacterium]|jgi:hypothetical protein|nr:hypothetical protein [Candidatus Latescibacterota bacterium]